MWQWLKNRFSRKPSVADRDQYVAIVAEMEKIKLQRHYTTLDAFNENDPAYVDALVRMAGSREMRFFLFDMREKLIGRLSATKATDRDTIAEIAGELKSLSIIQVYFEGILQAKVTQNVQQLNANKGKGDE